MNACQGLAADIGGTNTRLALVKDGKVCADTILRFHNAEFASPDDVISAYLSEHGNPSCRWAVLAIAAPVQGTVVRLTNHDWTFDTDSLTRTLGGAKVRFLNDFEALAHSLDRLTPERLIKIHGPDHMPLTGQTRLAVGAGTGFNAAAVYPAGDHRHVGVGECGHSTLPVINEEELRLWQYLSRNRARASNERALSGAGLREIYEWCCLEAGETAVPYSPADISASASTRTDRLCVAAATTWTTLLGRVVGDLALIFMATGGIVLCGGVSRSLRDFIQSPVFANAYSAKGRQSELVSAIPVWLLNDDYAALSGCAAVMAD